MKNSEEKNDSLLGGVIDSSDFLEFPENVQHCLLSSPDSVRFLIREIGISAHALSTIGQCDTSALQTILDYYEAIADLKQTGISFHDLSDLAQECSESFSYILKNYSHLQELLEFIPSAAFSDISELAKCQPQALCDILQHVDEVKSITNRGPSFSDLTQLGIEDESQLYNILNDIESDDAQLYLQRWS